MARRKPDLFIVGAPKCGTTSLDHWPETHPPACVSRPKQPRSILVNRAAHTLKRWKSLLGIRKPLVVGKWRIRANTSPRTAVFRMTPEHHAALTEYFTTEAKAMEGLLDRDLSHWLWPPSPEDTETAPRGV